ncbi:MAG: AIPR family protein [Candidatus Bipolaricaulota bacterium]|nr:AIPR family protein [Candidatus Bipolaricaulota bacterium]
MGTLIDWNALSQKIKSYSGESPYCTTPSKTFTYLALEYLLSLSPEEIEDAITDGPSDRGVDAVYVDERDDRNVVHLFQFKHVSSFEGSKRNFPSTEIDKLLSFCEDLLNEAPELQQTCNPILWTKVQEIWGALKNPEPSFEVHFCANMASLVDAQQKRVASALAKYRSFRVNHHTLDSLVELFIERKRPKIDVKLKVVDKNYFERTDGNLRGLIATLEATEIIKLITDPSDPAQVRRDVFNDNVRVYLTKKNRINKRIHATALSEKNVEFWYLNNGITVTCDYFSYQPGTRAPVVSLQNVQIVNGGQTANALFEAHKDQPEKLNDVLVLTRIYETRARDITAAIAEATNSQTPINTRDLRSNDDVQKKLEEAFRDQGYWYERKAKQHHGQPRLKRIDAMSAGQAFLAYSLGSPEVAKKDRARIFGDLYDSVFNDDITTQKLLAPLSVFGEIEAQKRTLQRQIKRAGAFDPDLLFLIDGAYHVLFTVSLLCEDSAVDPLSDAAKGLIPRAVELLRQLVQQESARDEAFTASRFFKDAKTKSKIQRAIAEANPG